MPMRRQDRATIITITSPTPGQKPSGAKFGVTLMPQTASTEVKPTTPPVPLPPLASSSPILDKARRVSGRATHVFELDG